MTLAPFQQLPFAQVPMLPRLPHRYFESRAETVAVSSRPFGRINLHVRTFGHGPPLLLLHGFMTTSYSWRYVRLALALLPRHQALLRWLVWRNPERWVHKNVHYFDETLKSREEQKEYAAPLRTPAGLRAFTRMLDRTLDVGAMGEFQTKLQKLGRFPVPLLLVYSARDKMVPPVVGKRFHALLPDSQFIELPNASHFAHVDATSAFLSAINPFLQDVRSHPISQFGMGSGTALRTRKSVPPEAR